MFFDIHSHILPSVDDGAENMEESIKLLELMQSQGITHVLATPHFYPQEDNLADFSKRTETAFILLKKEAEKRNLPKIYLGCEMLYFEGIGSSESLSNLCLNGSDFLLLELTDECIHDTLFMDILNIRNNMGITPIIAHVERYFKAKNYRKLLKFLQEEKIPAQINASSVLIPIFKRTIKKLLKTGIAYTIATDSHSVEERPPLLAPALNLITENYGEEYRERFFENSESLYNNIVLGGDE